jgi:hypothetical protein
MIDGTVEIGSWGILWIVWAAGALLTFLAIELTAIFTHRMDRTLSENLRKWLGIYPVKPWRKLGGVVFSSTLLSLVGIFIWHILT